MDVKVHLISMPWASPARPSIQTGALESYLRSLDLPGLEVRNYPAHLEIPFEVSGSLCLDLFRWGRKYGEFPYFLLFYRRYLAPELGSAAPLFESVVGSHVHPEISEAPDVKTLDVLDRVTQQWVLQKLVPEIAAGKKNIVGFTLNFDQTYASAYVSRLLVEALGSECAPLFVYGGYLASSPVGVMTLRQLKAKGLLVIGEGERKLESLVRGYLMPSSRFDVEQIWPPGIYPIDQADPFVFENTDLVHQGQVEDLRDLPEPDFRTYFTLWKESAEKDPIFGRVVRPQLIQEGSRGCFAKCDFCHLNAQWKGFRKMTPSQVFERTIKLTASTGGDFIQFVDNVCDTWAEGFADRILESGTKLGFFMELRAHHSEEFWTKLSKAGLSQVQIGLEALSPGLLKKMNKGTTVLQNLRALKCFAELGVKSESIIIINHPKSTIEDVEETRRVLKTLLHMEPVTMGDFILNAKSPIFDSLPSDVRKSLPVWKLTQLPASLESFIVHHRGFHFPAGLSVSTELRSAWLELSRWYQSLEPYSRRLNIVDLGQNEVEIEEVQEGHRSVVRVEGAGARVLKCCHRGLKLSEVVRELDVPADLVQKHLDEFAGRGWILPTGDHFLTVALRPRSELLKNFATRVRGHLHPQSSPSIESDRV